jgi:multidrug efflux pump subunit AcrB
MRISEYAIKNYQFTLLAFIMAVTIGSVTFFTIPRSEDPEIDIPEFTIAILYPGTSPADIEELVVNPIEIKVNEMEGIKRIKSSINDGLATINVEFNSANDADIKYQELIREINVLRPKLPDDIENIGVYKFKPSDVNIIQLALISENATTSKLKYYAEELKDELQKITMLKNIEIQGQAEQVVQIELKQQKMAEMHIPVGEIAKSLNNGLANIPGGGLVAGTKFFSIKTNANNRSLDNIRNMVVFTANSKNVILSDVADINFTFSQDRYITRLNGHRCVFLIAALKPGKNISDAQKIYKASLEDFKAKLPANIEMLQFFDQADNVNKRLSSLAKDCFIAILLVSITLLPLGFRAASIVMLSIPLSISIGLFLLNLVGITLNQISIVGLVVALGLLVDDSIVVVENIERWLRMGYSKKDAVIKATNQISLSVVGCTFTLIIAFIPLILLPGSSGDFIRGLPMAVIMSVLASMVVSLTIIPFLSMYILKTHKNDKGNFILRGLQKIIHLSYYRLLGLCLKKPVTTIIISGVIFFASLAIIPAIGFSLFPASEKPQFMINIIPPMQTNLASTDSIMKNVEQIIAAEPKVKYFASNVGKGNPRIYYNVSQVRERKDFGQVFVLLDEQTGSKKKLEIINKFREKFKLFPGAKIEVKNFEQGPGIDAPIEVRLFGKNLDSLLRYAEKIEMLLRLTEGTIYINNPLSSQKSYIRVNVNWEKARMLGIEKTEIDRAIRLSVTGLYVGKFYEANNQDYNIYLTNYKAGRAGLLSLNNLLVNNQQGKAIPISGIATIGLQTSPAGIDHYNKTRMVILSAFVQKGYYNNKVISEIVTKMNALNLSSGYSYSMGGEVEASNNSFGGIGMLLILTSFLFAGVLILIFKTFKSMLIVLSVIPLGIVGALISLWITGNPLSFVAVIGLIALIGIEVKNSILFVDFTNQLRKQGNSLDDAIRLAGEARFLPIVLTSFTAIGGLLAIAFSVNPLISPLAIVLIGGLLSSTILSRIVTPVIYKLLNPKI